MGHNSNQKPKVPEKGFSLPQQPTTMHVNTNHSESIKPKKEYILTSLIAVSRIADGDVVSNIALGEEKHAGNLSITQVKPHIENLEPLISNGQESVTGASEETTQNWFSKWRPQWVLKWADRADRFDNWVLG